MLEIAVTGSVSAPIKFLAEPGEEVVLSGSGGAIRGIQFIEHSGNTPKFVEVDGFIVRDFGNIGVLVRGTNDIVIRNVEVTNCSWGAIEVLESARVVVEGSRVHHNAMAGWTSAINFWACEDGNVIRGNFVWANTDTDNRESEGHGIILDYCLGWGDTLIENNVIWDNEGWCMNIFHSDGATIRNNTCWRNGLNRPGSGELNLRGNRESVHNNIFVSRAGAQAMLIYDEGDMYSIDSDYNLLWSPNHTKVAGWPPWSTGTVAQYKAGNPVGWDSHSVQFDPQLSDPTESDFNVNSDSPVVDFGINLFSSSIDVLGQIRPYDGDNDGQARVDLGAYEFVSGSSSGGGSIFVDSFEDVNIEGWVVVTQ